VKAFVFGTAVLLCLGFGTREALASPAKRVRGPDCSTAAGRAECSLACQADGLLGYCDLEVGCTCW
jgi:hypothetical protein